jgi:hypothetical protein
VRPLLFGRRQHPDAPGYEAVLRGFVFLEDALDDETQVPGVNGHRLVDAIADEFAMADVVCPQGDAWRRPRYPLDSYSPGDESEAICCADVLWAAWQAHPKAKRWLKGICLPEQ